MFRNSNMRVPFTIENGLQVVVRAGASLYEARGDLQLIVESMEEAGFGALQRQFEELKKKLFKQGLFDSVNKKAIPQYPSEISIITSPSGAAIKDYLNVAQRRYPACKKTIYSVAVQGEAASGQIVQAIKAVNLHATADVIVLIRGGGSIEDLWCFNDEGLANTIATSNIPIVTGIGHEIDYTIADFVADLRAATPSVAAELTCPDTEALLASLNYSQQVLKKYSLELIQKLSQNTDWYAQRLQRSHPKTIIQSQRESLRNLSTLLVSITNAIVKDSDYKFQSLVQRHRYLSPKNQLIQHTNTISNLTRRLCHTTNKRIEQQRHKLELCTATMQVVSPLNTLNRGYSITVDDQQSKNVITRFQDLKPGDQITTYLAEGEIVSTVKSTSSNTIIDSTSDLPTKESD